MRMTESLLEAHILVASLDSVQARKLLDLCKRYRPPKGTYSSRIPKFRSQVVEWIAQCRASAGPLKKYFFYYRYIAGLVIGESVPEEQVQELAGLRWDHSSEAGARRRELMNGACACILSAGGGARLKSLRAIAAAGLAGDMGLAQCRHARALLAGFLSMCSPGEKPEEITQRFLGKLEQEDMSLAERLLSPDPDPADDEILRAGNRAPDEAGSVDGRDAREPGSEAPAGDCPAPACGTGGPGDGGTPRPGGAGPAWHEAAAASPGRIIPGPVPPLRNPKKLAEALDTSIRSMRAIRVEPGHQTGQHVLPPGTVWTGILRITSGYHNFYPVFIWRDGVPLRIPDGRQRFPDYGNILFDNLREVNPARLASLKNGVFYNIQFEDGDLEPNRLKAGSTEPGTRYSLNLRMLFDEGRIVPSSEDVPGRRAFLVADATDGPGADFSASMLFVRLDAGTESLPVTLSGLEKSSIMVRAGDDSGLFGPFRMVTDARGLTYVQPSPERPSRPGIYRVFEQKDPCGLQTANVFGVPVQLRLAFTSPDFFDCFEEDRMSEEDLLASFAREVECRSSSSWDIARWLEDHRECIASFSTDSAYFNEERRARLLGILVSDFAGADLRDKTARLVVSLLTGPGVPPGHFDSLVDAAAASPRALARLESHRRVQDEIRSLEKERDALREELVRARLREKEDELRSGISALREELKQRRAEIGLADEAVSLEAHLASLRSEESKLSASRDRAAAELRVLAERREEANRDIAEFEGRLKNTVRRVADMAFDGAITAKILDAAQGWKETEESRARESRVGYIARLPRMGLEGKDLADELCRRFAEERRWPRNDVINLLVCLGQGFLTIISGPPGSGKTSSCNILARTLGLTGIAAKAAGTGLWPRPETASRYIPVSVERGWTSKRDFIGYYNPITRTFEASDPHRCECFRELDAEASANFAGLPYVILLDEANLSPMEYYFADFMNVCDERGPSARISLGDGTSCQVPDTLRFLATINSDHTTEELSPRLVDRAFIISLDGDGVRAEHVSRQPDGDRQPVDWARFLRAFGREGQRLPSETSDLLNGLSESARELGISVSPRSRIACAGYAAAAAHWFEGTESASPEVLAADYACEQKILPQVSGSGSAYHERLERFASELEGRGLLRSASRARRILERGIAQMDYFRFF